MAKSKDTKQQKKAQPAGDEPRLSAHPKARRQIAAAKAWGGLVAFLVVQYLSLKSGLPMFDAGIRALAAGVGGYLLGWVAAVLVWRQLAVAELEALRRKLTTPPSSDDHVAAT
ncbi:MAG TPA: hypothetical protein VFR97_03390 [Capillimicrobium sp.]|nr:hypothetical protein [Capillimicrobium sp.]